MDQQIVDPANNHAYTSIFQGTGVEDFKKCIQHHLMSFQGRDPDRAGDQDVYRAIVEGYLARAGRSALEPGRVELG